MAFLPGIRYLDNPIAVTLFNRPIQVAVVDHSVIVPFHPDGRLLIRNYPLLFPGIYSNCFPEEDHKLRAVMSRNRKECAESVNGTPFHQLLQTLAQAEKDSSYLGKGSFWQASELLYQQLEQSDSIRRISCWSELYRDLDPILKFKNRIYSHYSPFLNHYYYYLNSSFQQEFYHLFLLLEYMDPDHELVERFHQSYRKFQHLNQVHQPISERVNALLDLKRTMRPLYNRLSDAEMRADQYHWHRWLPGINRFLSPSASLTPRHLRALVENYHYQRLLMICVMIRHHRQLVTLELMIVVIALICLFSTGYYLFYRKNSSPWLAGISMVLFGIVSLILIIIMMRLDRITDQLMPDYELSSFEWDQRMENDFPEYAVQFEEPIPPLLDDSIEMDQRYNLLILGKGGITHRDRLSGRGLGGNLTDAIMVVSIDPSHKRINLISIPRDLVFGQFKINAVYSISGPQKFKTAIKTITGMEIQSLVVLDFMNFKSLIDILGGVEIYVDRDLHDRQWFKISKGLQRLTGDQCLKYLRSRRTTSDFSRSYRQQQIMAELYKKLSNRAFIHDLFQNKFYSLLQWYSGLETDLDVRELLNLYRNFRQGYQTRHLVLSSSNCLEPYQDVVLGYYLLPKSGSWESVKQTIQRTLLK